MVQLLRLRLRLWIKKIDPRKLFCLVGMHNVDSTKLDYERWVSAETGRILNIAEVTFWLGPPDTRRGDTVIIGKNEKLKVEYWCSWHEGWY